MNGRNIMKYLTASALLLTLLIGVAACDTGGDSEYFECKEGYVEREPGSGECIEQSQLDAVADCSIDGQWVFANDNDLRLVISGSEFLYINKNDCQQFTITSNNNNKLSFKEIQDQVFIVFMSDCDNATYRVNTRSSLDIDRVTGLEYDKSTCVTGDSL